MWADQSYIIATDGINNGLDDTLFIATLGLLGYVVEVEIVADTGQGYGFPRQVIPEPVAYYYPRQNLIRIKININNKEVIKEYITSETFSRIFARFIGSTEIVINIVAKIINSIKDITIKAIKYDRN